MQISNTGLKFIGLWEKCELKPYPDLAGIPTIGYGSTYYEDGTPVQLTDPQISQDRAYQLLRIICTKMQEEVNKLVKVPLTQNQFDAIMSMVYNIGVAAFAGSTLLRSINDKQPVVEDLFTRWNKIRDAKTGQLRVLNGLTNRRKAEFQLFMKR